jgi:hypothetical protein
MKLLCLILAALLLSAVVIDASPTTIQAIEEGGGRGGAGSGGGNGGHGGPNWNEDTWKARAVERPAPAAFGAVEFKSAFADRKLMAAQSNGGRGRAGAASGQGGHGGPGWSENVWKSKIRPTYSSFGEVEARTKAFANRRLLVEAVPRAMQETEEVPEWREGLAGVKKEVRSTVVGTPLPSDRFDDRTRV